MRNRYILPVRNTIFLTAIVDGAMGLRQFLNRLLKHYDLKGSAITLNDLEENLNIIKEKGGILNDGYNTPVACNIDGTGC